MTLSDLAILCRHFGLLSPSVIRDLSWLGYPMFLSLHQSCMTLTDLAILCRHFGLLSPSVIRDLSWLGCPMFLSLHQSCMTLADLAILCRHFGFLAPKVFLIILASNIFTERNWNQKSLWPQDIFLVNLNIRFLICWMYANFNAPYSKSINYVTCPWFNCKGKWIYILKNIQLNIKATI
jgi:hypothetical protein